MSSCAKAVINEIQTTVAAAVHRTREELHTLSSSKPDKQPAGTPPVQSTQPPSQAHDEPGPAPPYTYDLAFRFIGANDLPKMDIGGLSDPYFIASIDSKISYTSSVQIYTLTPVWNEPWMVLNVPENAVLEVKVYDKDDGMKDDYIGSFTTSCKAFDGAREFRIESSAKAQMGTMWLELSATPTRTHDVPQYTFDGPVNFSQHFNQRIGLIAGSRFKDSPDSPPSVSTSGGTLSSIEAAHRHPYSTWKVHLKGIVRFFGDHQQHWNPKSPPARKIFESGPLVRKAIETGHRVLYARTTMNDFGYIEDAEDFWRLLAPHERSSTRDGSHSANPAAVDGHRPQNRGPRGAIKPAVYTYVIGATDDMFRFSETGAAFFTDFASKHALHSGCAEVVRYSGEFHPRPLIDGGWAALGEYPEPDVEWELLIDNSSGTYGPDKKLLPALAKTLEYNFPGIKVRALDYEDKELAQSKKDLNTYAGERNAGKCSHCEKIASGKCDSCLHKDKAKASGEGTGASSPAPTAGSSATEQPPQPATGPNADPPSNNNEKPAPR